MKGEEHNDSNFVQCQYCGNIYKIESEIPVEKLMIDAWCPKCGNRTGLNCGNDEDEIYRYINLNVDERYYRY